MTLSWLVASLHLLTLPLGAGALFARGRALRRAQNEGDLKEMFRADDLWGLAAVLWIGTGVWRAFGGLEKGTAYYLANPWFHAKIGLFLLVFLLELRPMITLIRWRRARRRGTPIDLGRARVLARIGDLELALVVAIVFLAAGMARGVGLE